MNEKVIDLSMIPEDKAELVLSGWKKFNENTSCARYFGYVDKHELKKLVGKFHYFDGRAFIGGGLVATGIILGWGFYQMHVQKKSEENK